MLIERLPIEIAPHRISQIRPGIGSYDFAEQLAADLGTLRDSLIEVGAQRLADFVRDHALAHVLGTHIEQTATPYLDYPRGTTYQPNEHPLELTRASVLELNEAFQSMHGKLEKVALPEFTVVPRAARP